MMLAGWRPACAGWRCRRACPHRHHQRADQVEGRHRHDQREDDEHHAFSSCTAANQVRFWRVQSRISRLPLRLAASWRPRARLVQVAQLQAHAGGAFQAEDALGVLDVEHGQRRVVFVVAAAEGAQHRHLLQARHHARRRDLAAGRDQRHRVARHHAQLARQVVAQQDAEAAGREPGQQRVLDLRRHLGHLRLQRRVDAAHHHALHGLAARQQACAPTKGAAPTTCGFLRTSARVSAGSGSAPPSGRTPRRRDDAEHAVAHVLLKAVHHRQHDDQRRHAQRDAQHGRPR
jgi:hypothetical protein